VDRAISRPLDQIGLQITKVTKKKWPLSVCGYQARSIILQRSEVIQVTFGEHVHSKVGEGVKEGNVSAWTLPSERIYLTRGMIAVSFMSPFL